MARGAPSTADITEALPPEQYWYDPVRRIWHDAPRRKIAQEEVLTVLIRYAKTVLGKICSAGTWARRALHKAECSPLYTVKAFVQMCSRKSRANRTKGGDAFRLWLDLIGLNTKGNIQKEYNRLAGLFYTALDAAGVRVKRSARIRSGVFSNVVVGLSFFKSDTAARCREHIQREEELREAERLQKAEDNGVRKHLTFLQSIGIVR